MKKKLAVLVLVAGATMPPTIRSAAADDWEGLWIGAGGAYGMANEEFKTGFDDSTPGPSISNQLGGSGGFGTVGLGYDRRLLRSLVIGAFADYDFGEIGADFSGLNFKVRNQLSLGGRIGYLVAPSTLFFTSFGYARADASGIVETGFGTIAHVEDYDGYFIGSGFEMLIGNGFSLKAEYRFTSLQADSVRFLGDPDNILKASIKPQIESARLSLNYRFGDSRNERGDTPAPRITSTWTSLYLGVGGGLAVVNSSAPDLISGNLSENKGADGGAISVTGGYDYQLNKSFVIGAFADADYTSLKTTEALSFLGASESIRSKFRDILMIGGRLGYLAAPDALLFVNGGYANAGLSDTTATVSVGCGCGGSASEAILNGRRFSGGFVGGGIETRLNDALSLKAEYRYIDFASEQLSPADGLGISGFPATFDPTIQMGRLSLNWRFSGSARAFETATAPD